MPNVGDCLFRDSSDPDNWFNARADSTGYRVVSAIQVAEMARGNWAETNRWVDFWYDWMEPVFSFGDQSSWSKSNGRLLLQPGVYQISVTCNIRGSDQFNVCLHDDAAGYFKRLGLITPGGSATREGGQGSYLGVIEVTQPAAIRFELADSNGNGSNGFIESMNWECLVMKYDIVGGVNPDEVLTRLDGADQWTNEDAEQILGGLVSYSSHRADTLPITEVRPDAELTWFVWTSIDHPNVVTFDTAQDYVDVNSGWAAIVFKQPGLYEISLTFTLTSDRRRLCWNTRGFADAESSQFNRMGTLGELNQQSVATFIANIPSGTGSLVYMTNINNALEEMDLKSTTVSISRLGPAL